MSESPGAGFDRHLIDLADTAGRAAHPASADAIRLRAQRRTTRRHAALGVLVVALLGGFAVGFLRPVPHAVAPGGVPTTAPAASPTQSPRSSPTTSPPPSASARTVPPPECGIDDLKIWEGSGGAATGHFGVVFLFQNIGARTCRIQGYPGMDIEGPNRTPVVHAKRTLNGYLGGVASGPPPPVDLAPGGFASALAEAQSDPNGNPACVPGSTALVTPPDGTVTVGIAWNSGCSALQIHPVVPGTTGQAG